MAELVVIVGPIASGKSTVARELGVRLRAAGRSVAVLDLDDIVVTIGGFADLGAERLRQAQHVHGDLVGAWLSQGFDVIAHGPFFEPDEDQALLHAVPDGTEPRRVRLVATYEAALERVGFDPERALSKDPDLLRRTFERMDSLLPGMPPGEWVFDTTQTSPTEIADVLAGALVPPPP